MSAATTPSDFDVAVVGAGATGLATGLALARAGLRTLILGPKAPPAMGRSVALLDGAVKFLQAVGAWDACAGAATPMRRLTLIDATDNLFRPPPVTFDCAEIGRDAFGWNIELDTLIEGLEAAVRSLSEPLDGPILSAVHTLRDEVQAEGAANDPAPLVSALTPCDAHVTHIQQRPNSAGSAEAFPDVTRVAEAMTACRIDPDGVRIAAGSGAMFGARAIVGADGARSGVREAAGIAAKVWTYPQTALTTVVEHRRPHRDTSTEFHTREGPFTLVPMAGNRSAVVWVAAPEAAERLHALDEAALARAIEDRAQSMLGAMRIAGPRGLVPLRGLSAGRMALGRAFLVGEAAHVFPPIGAQGLNLGLRDAAALARLLPRAFGTRNEAAFAGAAGAYERARRADIRLRTFAVDVLGRTLLADVLPADFARGLGLLALSTIGPLRRLVMRQGLGAE